MSLAEFAMQMLILTLTVCVSMPLFSILGLAVLFGLDSLSYRWGTRKDNKA